MNRVGVNLNSFDWTAERETELRRMHADGLSHGTIAKAFGLSRNAICGKIHRLGLKRNGANHVVKVNLPLGRPLDQPRRPPGPRPKVAIRFTPPTKRTEAIVDIADENVPLAQRKTLMQLTNGSCRWPLGEGPAMTFCGAPGCDVDKGQSYCPGHALRAYQPARPRDGRRFRF